MVVAEGIREGIRSLIRKRTGAVAAKVVGVDRVTLYRAMNGVASAETMRKVTEALTGKATATTATNTGGGGIHGGSLAA